MSSLTVALLHLVGRPLAMARSARTQNLCAIIFEAVTCPHLGQPRKTFIPGNTFGTQGINASLCNYEAGPAWITRVTGYVIG